MQQYSNYVIFAETTSFFFFALHKFFSVEIQNKSMYLIKSV
jgi:hypothetical protein